MVGAELTTMINGKISKQIYYKFQFRLQSESLQFTKHLNEIQVLYKYAKCLAQMIKLIQLQSKTLRWTNYNKDLTPAAYDSRFTNRTSKKIQPGVVKAKMESFPKFVIKIRFRA